MRSQETREKIKNWTRVAAWLGVLLTEPKVRARIGQSIKDRAESFADKAGSRYNEAVHRMEGARDALRAKPETRSEQKRRQQGAKLLARPPWLPRASVSPEAALPRLAQKPKNGAEIEFVFDRSSFNL